MKKAEFVMRGDTETIFNELKASDNELEACYGRMLSALTPELEKVMSAERKRGTDPSLIVNIAPGLAVSIMFQMLPPFQFPQTETMLSHITEELLCRYKEGSVQYLEALKQAPADILTAGRA